MFVHSELLNYSTVAQVVASTTSGKHKRLVRFGVRLGIFTPLHAALVAEIHELSVSLSTSLDSLGAFCALHAHELRASKIHICEDWQTPNIPQPNVPTCSRQ